MTSLILFDLSIYFIFSLIMLHCILCFFNVLLQQKNHLKASITTLIYCVYICLKIFTYSFHLNNLSNIIITLLSLSITTFLYKSSKKLKTLAIFLELVFVNIVEVAVLYLYSFAIQIPTKQLSEDKQSFILMSAVALLVLLITVKLYQYLSTAKHNSIELDTYNCLRIMFTPIASMIIIYLLHKGADSQSYFHNGTIVIIVFLILLINLIFYYLYEKLLKVSNFELENALLNRQIEFYAKQYQNVERNFNDNQVLKHDLKHLLTYIKSKFDTDSKIDTNKIEEDMVKAIGDISTLDIKTYSKNIFLNSVLNYLIASAERMNIGVEIEIDIDCEIVDEKLLCIILGNAIDNAIESFDFSKSQLKKIIIQIFEEHQNLYIKISNPYAHKIICNDIFPKTSKKDIQNHGIGLKSINRLVENHGGVMRFSSDDNIFKLEIVMYTMVAAK